MSKPVITFVFKVLRNGLLLAHTLHMSKPNVTRVQSATQWNASVHTLTHVQTCDYVRFKVLRNGLLRYILDTCPNLM